MSKENQDEGPKVVVHEIDHAEEARKRVKAEDSAREATVRAGYVTGLQNELAFLERQPEPNRRRIADVKESLAQYAEKPERPRREAAVPNGAPKPPETQQAPPVTPVTPPAEPPKAPATKKAPAKKTAAKKTAAKS